MKEGKRILTEKKSTIWLSLLSVFVVISLLLHLYNHYTMTSLHGEIYYTLYIGTNDKDTYKPEIPFEETFRIVDTICNKYLQGVTFCAETGSWVDETGTVTHENTIQITVYDTDAKTIYALSDEIIKALNQNSILIVTNRANIQFYNGKPSFSDL